MLKMPNLNGKIYPKRLRQHVWCEICSVATGCPTYFDSVAHNSCPRHTSVPVSRTDKDPRMQDGYNPHEEGYQLSIKPVFGAPLHYSFLLWKGKGDWIGMEESKKYMQVHHDTESR